jgi:hypothetical protein
MNHLLVVLDSEHANIVQRSPFAAVYVATVAVVGAPFRTGF